MPKNPFLPRWRPKTPKPYSSASQFVTQFNAGRPNSSSPRANMPAVGSAGRPVFGPSTLPTGFYGDLPRIGEMPLRQKGISVRAKYGVGRVDKFNRSMDMVNLGPIAKGLTKLIRELGVTPEVAKELMFAFAKWMLVRIYARTPIDTGYARSEWSLALQVNSNSRIGFTIINNVPYVYYLEFGTRFSQPYSMLGSTYREAKRKIKHVLKESLFASTKTTSAVFWATTVKRPDLAKAKAAISDNMPFSVHNRRKMFGIATGGFTVDLVRPSDVLADAATANIWLALHLEDPMEFASQRSESMIDWDLTREAKHLEGVWATFDRDRRGRRGTRSKD